MSGRPKWLSRDPLGEYAGINLYGYVADDPANWVDPLGLCVYFGGSREGHGHFWVAVDLPHGGVAKYDYSAAGAYFLNTSSNVSVHGFPNIQAAANGDEYYGFAETKAADRAVLTNMFRDKANLPDYKLLTHNCTDASCAVAGYPSIVDGIITPTQALNRMQMISAVVNGGGGDGQGGNGPCQ